MNTKFFKISLEAKLAKEKRVAAMAKELLKDVLFMTNFSVADIIKYYYAIAKEIDRPASEIQSELNALRK